MRSSKHYQRLLQLVRRSNDIVLFFVGYYLGSGEIFVASFLLILRLIVGYTSSELVYRRLKSTIREG
jgi:hypothetical protein